MNIEDFEDGLDRYGADLDAWPEELSTAAHALIASNDPVSFRASELVRATVDLDTLLTGASTTAHPAPPYLRNRILANLEHAEEVDPVGRLLRWFGDSLWRTAITALLPLIVGFGAGVFTEGQSDNLAEIDGLVYSENMQEFNFDDF